MRLFKIACFTLAIGLTFWGCSATGPDEEEEEPTEYSLSVSTDPSGGGSVDPSGGTYEEGTEVTVEATSNEGWTFDGWTGDQESSENPLTFTINSDTELTANFSEEQQEPTEYSLTVNTSPSEGGSVDPESGTYEEGQEVTVEATPNEEWIFSGWSGDISSQDNPLTFEITSDTELSANFEEEPPSEYNLTVSTDPSEGGSVSPSSGTYQQGEQVTVEATPKNGWEFSGWSGDIDSEENPLTFTIDSDTDLTANFTEKPKYSLSASANPSEGGSVDPSSGTYFEGEEVTVEAVASDGWRFTGWSGDKSSQDNPLTFQIASDTDLTANFEEIASGYSNQVEITNDSNSESLTFGMDASATDGFDSGLDKEAPPTPPQGSFYANFKIDGYNLFKDYRPVTREKTVWELHFGMGESNSVTLNWDFSTSEHAGSLMLVDDVNNPTVEVDMEAQNSYEVSDTSIDQLFIIQE